MTAEVNEQTDVKPGRFEVIEKLGFFSPCQLDQELSLDNDLSITNQVSDAFLLQSLTFVVNHKSLLRLKGYIPSAKLDLVGFLINRL